MKFKTNLTVKHWSQLLLSRSKCAFTTNIQFTSINFFLLLNEIFLLLHSDSLYDILIIILLLKTRFFFTHLNPISRYLLLLFLFRTWCNLIFSPSDQTQRNSIQNKLIESNSFVRNFARTDRSPFDRMITRRGKKLVDSLLYISSTAIYLFLSIRFYWSCREHERTAITTLKHRNLKFTWKCQN